MKRGTDNNDSKELKPAALENILIGAYDDFVKENAEIRANVGLTETITREAIGGCCDWCSKLEGTYKYGEEPKDVYKKHDNCTCVVTAKTDKGYTDVWSKEQYENQKKARIARANEILADQNELEETHRKQRERLLYESGNDGVNRRKKKIENREKKIEKIRKSNTIRVAKVIMGHANTPKKAKANEVIDHTLNDGTVDARGFYDNDGMKEKDIHTTNHGNSRTHPYGEHGEHAHDYEWDENGRLKNKTTRELTEQERRDNGDIL